MVRTPEIARGASFFCSFQVDPSFPDPYVNKGLLVLQRDNNAQGAMDQYQQAIKQDEQCQTAYLHSAQLYLRLSEHEKASQMYDMAIEWSKTEVELSEICAFKAASDSQIEAARQLQAS